MKSRKTSGGSFSGKGYYIALILCAVAIGISGYLYYRNTDEPDHQAQPSASMDQNPGGEVAAVATQPSTATEATGSQEQTMPKPSAPMKRTTPVSGETVTGHAVDDHALGQPLHTAAEQAEIVLHGEGLEVSCGVVGGKVGAAQHVQQVEF